MPIMLSHIVATLCVVAVLALMPGEVLAQTEGPALSSLRVTGEATLTVPPDQVQIDIGVVTQGGTAEAAVQNAQKLNAVLTELRKVLSSEDEITTIGYSLHPDYRYPREDGGQPTLTGYTASHTVQVKTGKLEEVGHIIDRATRAGANTIQRLMFTLRDEGAIRDQALREAVTRARAKADALASALELRIVRVLTIEGGDQGPRPIYQKTERFLEATAASAPTPVEPGTLEVHATVSLTVEITQ